VQLLPDPPWFFCNVRLPDHSFGEGAIAQLGERLVCNQKVAGSIPAGSTRICRPHACSTAGGSIRFTRDDSSTFPRREAMERARLIAWCQAHRVLFNNPESFLF
jgi:hypothetical protein